MRVRGLDEYSMFLIYFNPHCLTLMLYLPETYIFAFRVALFFRNISYLGTEQLLWLLCHTYGQYRLLYHTDIKTREVLHCKGYYRVPVVLIFYLLPLMSEIQPNYTTAVVVIIF